MELNLDEESFQFSYDDVALHFHLKGTTHDSSERCSRFRSQSWGGGIDDVVRKTFMEKYFPILIMARKAKWGEEGENDNKIVEPG